MLLDYSISHRRCVLAFAPSAGIPPGPGEHRSVLYLTAYPGLGQHPDDLKSFGFNDSSPKCNVDEGDPTQAGDPTNSKYLNKNNFTKIEKIETIL